MAGGQNTSPSCKILFIQRAKYEILDIFRVILCLLRIIYHAVLLNFLAKQKEKYFKENVAKNVSGFGLRFVKKKTKNFLRYKVISRNKNCSKYDLK